MGPVSSRADAPTSDVGFPGRFVCDTCADVPTTLIAWLTDDSDERPASDDASLDHAIRGDGGRGERERRCARRGQQGESLHRRIVTERR